MRLAILTTDTLHHARFVQQIAPLADDLLVMAESPRAAPPFPIRHALEDARDEHERKAWFAGRDMPLASVSPVVESRNVNDAASAAQLREFQPDLMILFGVGKVGGEVVGACARATINLHGGDPELYRGLDSHFWAIYHGDFPSLVTTLHQVAPQLDTGEIVSQTALPIRRGMGLHELRQVNTEACVDLARQAISQLQKTGQLISRSQKACGRYYSFMPAVLKECCLQRFQLHTSRL